MADFAHLHIHTEYSLLDGACRIPALIDRVKELGQSSVAITDHGVMYGVVDFYKEAKAKGIHPIIGCEVYVAPRSRKEMSYRKGEGAHHLVLLCENETGYRNLIQLVSLGFLEGFYFKPRIDTELLRQHAEGLIALSACLSGVVPTKILQGDLEGAKEAALEYQQIFGPEHYYLELQDHGLEEQQTVNRGILQIAKETGIPLVVTNDAHYLTKRDAEVQDALLCIQTGKTIEEEDRMRFSTQEFYVKSTEEMAALFPEYPEAMENTVHIARRCQFDFEFGHYHLPVFDVPEGYTSDSYLEHLCQEGYARRYGAPDEEKQKRLQYELNMIKQMGFVDYFLIVSDFIRYAKSQGIPVGPGRGSAAGSLVSYCLGITDLDPLKYSLYFERFLNPERISMPDIDIDFCYVRRGEVIDYVVRKYGADRVAQIVTFGTMAARAAIRDVGRVLNIPYAEVDKVAKLVPNELKMTLEKAWQVSPQLRELVESDARLGRLMELSRAVEGMPRHASTHAAGVVITKNPVDSYVPLAKNDESVVTQFPMTTLEELGLLKMDFLGLRNLTVISDAEKMIRRREPEFSIEAVSDCDEETFAMLSQGKTSGVFQLESVGITNVVTGLQPHSIEDITAVVALYRPGPMQSIPRYIECKHHPEKVQYKHPLLEDILSVTYGCMVYQEQVMDVFRKLAGYSLGKADMVRRAMSKKKVKELEKERINFIYGNEELGIDGAVKRGVPEQTAASLFDEIMDFANYAFNKAHAVSYAIVSYRTAYLKCHYPKEYMAALLTSVLDSATKISEYILECRELGIDVLPPDVNQSEDAFTVVGEHIRFGLAAVKNVGRSFIRRMVEERNQGGPFQSFEDFCNRLDSELNKRAVESLIRCGAFDSMGYKRAALLLVYEKVLGGLAQNRRMNVEGQLDLFGMTQTQQREESIVYPDVPEASKRELLTMEKETTGLYLSGHPMDEYLSLSRLANAVPMGQILNEFSEGETAGHQFSDGMEVILTGVVTALRLKTTKNNTMMAYVTLEDKTGAMELIVFSRVLGMAGAYLKEDAALLVQGKINVREDEIPKILCDAIYPLRQEYIEQVCRTKQPGQSLVSEKQAAKSNLRLYLQVSQRDGSEIIPIKRLLQQYPGDTPVILFERETRKRFMADRELWVSESYELLEKLRAFLGEANVVMK